MTIITIAVAPSAAYRVVHSGGTPVAIMVNSSALPVPLILVDEREVAELAIRITPGSPHPAPWWWI